ncbi:hypothetical protein [Paenibacillus rigui]|uniref:SbsA Ig-like domain-containing protein n=1 Tax=Paenibacillus rigui TaxID=554312 RepID=A0A229UNK1_9BACL|nr:hypothetical protein [Paenibacillus rigui]OXM85077.1 hypothetical protein CF651_15805 [Paenibacillus rigui]
MKNVRVYKLMVIGVLCFMMLTGNLAPAGVQASSESTGSGLSVTKLEALNPITLQVTFSAPLPAEDVQLDRAKANFVFDQGLAIRNIPQLKTGATATYIVPTTVQTPGAAYTLKYKEQPPVSFTGNGNKLPLRSARQVSYDTFEVESSLEDGVTDYANIVQADIERQGALAFALDEQNQYQGKTYQIISSLRDSTLTLTPEKGQPIQATYVPYTQATDGRQAPKYRLPEGQELKPGVNYTVSSDWATIQSPAFTAAKTKPLHIKSVKAVNDSTLEVTLDKDPKDELFASRSLQLTAPDGAVLTAQYKVLSRKGPVGTFELQKGGKLLPGVSYTVKPVGKWAKVKGNKLTVKL